MRRRRRAPRDDWLVQDTRPVRVRRLPRLTLAEAERGQLRHVAPGRLPRLQRRVLAQPHRRPGDALAAEYTKRELIDRRRANGWWHPPRPEDATDTEHVLVYYGGTEECSRSSGRAASRARGSAVLAGWHAGRLLQARRARRATEVVFGTGDEVTVAAIELFAERYEADSARADAEPGAWCYVR